MNTVKPLQRIKKSRSAPVDGSLKRVIGFALVLGVAATVGAGTTNELLPARLGQTQTHFALFLTNVQNAICVLEQHGVQFDPSERPALAALHRSSPPAPEAIIQQLLASHILFDVHINPEMRVKVNAGAAAAGLVKDEWQFFLARIQNESGTTAPLQISVLSPDAWLEAEVVTVTNLPATLSGAPLDYRVVKLRSHETGPREARIGLHVGQGTQDLGFRNEVDILFECQTKPAAAGKPPQPRSP